MFRISALPLIPFAPLFSLDDTALAARRARRVMADARPGFPCRVSLIDALPGETVILANYRHHDAPTPFRATHAVFVREVAIEARLDAGDVPAMLRTRTLSLRGFDTGGDMVASEVVGGERIEAGLAAISATRRSAMCISTSPAPAATRPAPIAADPVAGAPVGG